MNYELGEVKQRWFVCLAAAIGAGGAIAHTGRLAADPVFAGVLIGAMLGVGAYGLTFGRITFAGRGGTLHTYAGFSARCAGAVWVFGGAVFTALYLLAQ